FWESVEKPLLIKFLEFRLREGNLSDSKTEHHRYSEELDTIVEYLSDSCEIVEQVNKWKISFKNDKSSKKVKDFWELYEVIQSESMFYKEKSRLQQKDKLNDLKDQIGVEQVQHVLSTTKETFSQNLELQKTVIKQHLLSETNAGSIIGRKRNRGSGFPRNKEHELDSDDQEEKYQQSSQQKRKCTEPVVDAENNPFLGSKNNLDGENESILSLSDTEIVPNCPAIINDVIGLELGPLPRKEFRWPFCGKPYTADIVCFQFFSFTKVVTAEANFIMCRSLSHVLLLKPKQHCPLIVEGFGDELLVTMHDDIIQRLTKQETEFDNELLMKLVRIVKEITRDDAVSELQILTVGHSYGERAILKAIRNIIKRVPRLALKSPVGEVELCTTYIDTILSLLFSDPDRIQEEMNNFYLLCTDLIRIAIFNKDAINFYNMNCMLGFQVVGRHITFYLTTLLCDVLYVMAEVCHIDVPMSLEQ
ncbi:11713_t:CDS:10, partial [Scutellospora calospora]